MRLAILSDIHGNLPALEAVLQDLLPFNIQYILVAGDLVGGPRPNETIRRLRTLDCSMIRGNSDTDLLLYGAGRAPIHWYTSKAYAAIRWQFRQIYRDTMSFLQSLPEQLVFKKHRVQSIRVVHGSPSDPSEPIFPDPGHTSLERAFAVTSEPVLVCGHTHLPWKLQRGQRLALNPGAVSYPLNGTKGAQYAILDLNAKSWHIEHRQVHYDLDLIRREFIDSGFLEEGGSFARSILCSLATGENITNEFLAFTGQMLSDSALNQNGFIPDEVWERASKQFDWPEVNLKTEIGVYSD